MIGDVLWALPSAVLVGVLPGLAVASLLAPDWRWWERAVAAPGLSVGLAGILGLIAHDTHVAFDAATVLPVEAALALAAGVRLHRRSTTGDRTRPRRERSVALAVSVGLAAGLSGAVLMAVSQRDQAVPLGTDTPVHGAAVVAIVAQHDSLAAVPEPVDQTAVSRPRTGLEATAALVSELGGPDPAVSLFALGLVAVAVLPLGLVALTLEGTGSTRLAVLVPLLAAGLPYPRVAVEFGGYPLLAESTLIVPMVLAAARVAAGREVRAGVAMAAAGVAAMWITHGTELVTAAALGVPLVAAVLLRARRAGWVRDLARLAVGCATAALLVSLLRRMPQLPAPVGSPLDGPDVPPTDSLLAPVSGLGLSGFWSGFSQYVFPEQALVLLYVAGLGAALLRRQARWVVLAHALLLGALADDMLWGHLRRLWTTVFPWSSRDRLGAVEFWALPLIMGLGLLFLADVVAATLRRVRPATAARVAVAVTAAVALVAAVAGLRHDAAGYASAVADNSLVTAADSTALQRMSATLPAGAVVLTDGTDDAGQWIAALTRQQAFFYKDYLNHHDRDARVLALQQACTSSVDPALFRGIDAVFVGARRQSDATHPWSLQCMRSVPWLEPVVDVRSGGGEAAVFAITRQATRGTAAVGPATPGGPPPG